VKQFLYPLLRLYRSLVFLITRGVADQYDDQGLAKSIAEGDLRLWRSGLQSNCPLVERVFEDFSIGRTVAPLRVLDFGGGGGRHGFDLTRRGVAKWFVVETPALAAAASRTLSETGIEFGSNIEHVKNQANQFDLVHVSSSLQYTNNPSAVLKELVGLKPEYLVFEKLVLTQRKSPIEMFQYSLLGDNIPEPPKDFKLWINAVRYPLIAIPISRFLETLGTDFEVISHSMDPVQSHLPLFRGLGQHTFVVKRKVA
jgi:putative methyltransferase (TIGR04325 family)